MQDARLVASLTATSMLLVGLGFPMVGVIKHEVGRHEIVVSVVAETEVVKLEGVASDEAEKAILEFFGRDYVLRANLDVPGATMPALGP